MATNGKPRFLVPEVVQTSEMDCGPASLKCLLAGFGVNVSYGRLREACQTAVDGTSIDRIEELAKQLGLDAEQQIVPAGEFLANADTSLPALVVTVLPNGFTHFVVVWNRLGGYLQLMDPAVGRRWVRASDFESEIYTHTMDVDAAAWREWAGSPERLARLQKSILVTTGADASAAIAEAASDESWKGLGALDAASRMIKGLVDAKAVSRSRATSLLHQLFRDAQSSGGEPIPAAHWSVTATDDEEQIRVRGAVMVCIRGTLASQSGTTGASEQEPPAQIPDELMRALKESDPKPLRTLLQMLRADGVAAPTLVITSLLAAALLAIVEATVFRSVIDASRQLGLQTQRLVAVVVVIGLLVAVTAVERTSILSVVRMGRRLETRVRMAFAEMIPRIGDAFFRTRPSSDMAERSHALHGLRTLPSLGASIVRMTAELVVTVLAIVWITPSLAWIAAVAAVLSVAVPFLVSARIAEHDLRLRTHTGTLSRFYLDALLGLAPMRTHGAERAIRREHESQLTSWVLAGRALLRANTWAEGAQSALTIGLSAILTYEFLTAQMRVEQGLLFVYWALNVPQIGQELASAIRRYPVHRNLALRVFEPLAKTPTIERPGAVSASASASVDGEPTHGVRIEFANVSVLAGGHEVLREVSLTIEPGAHIAVVGASGAGKSTLVGTLLGWAAPSSGILKVNEVALDESTLRSLREETAWVDPAVQIWNANLVQNLKYGVDEDKLRDLGHIVNVSELVDVLEKLPLGMQTELGDGGGKLSGGEGQRVRLARAMCRHDARLVILDEPFRGLEKSRRHALMEGARAHWQAATMLCVTHDIEDTLPFDEVVVVENGRVCERGRPSDLRLNADSRYASMLRDAASVRESLWMEASWRRVSVSDGTLVETRATGVGE